MSWRNRVALVVVLAFLAVATAAWVGEMRAASAARTADGWTCPAGGTCHVLIEWNEKEPTTLYILTNPPGCSAEPNGEVGWIVTCE